MANEIIKKLWEIKGFSPNRAQKNAILFDERKPLFITAAPGSGKTRVLLWRTVYLIVEKNISPDKIFLSTFTEKAALQLKEGLKDLLGTVSNITDKKYDLARMYLGTIHSNCRRILIDRAFSVSSDRKILPHILDELGQYLYVSRRRNWSDMLKSVGLEAGLDTYRKINSCLGTRQQANSGSRHYAAMNTIKFFNRLSEELADPGPLKSDDDTLNKLFQMYRFYLESLRSQNIAFTDLSLLQADALRVLLSGPEGRRHFEHVIIDEYQDTNTVQEKIVFTLAESTQNLCVVGDDDQALYRFRGATVENFVEFPKRCEKYYKVTPKTIPLHKNYRSLKGIVDISRSFMQMTDWQINGKTYRIPKMVEAARGDRSPAVFVTDEDHPDKIAPQIAQFIRRLKSEKVINDYNEVAILFSYLKGNSNVERLSNALNQEGINVYAPRAGCFLDLDESLVVFGLFMKILSRSALRDRARAMPSFRDWIQRCDIAADREIELDAMLGTFISNKHTEIERVKNDYKKLQEYCRRKKIEFSDLIEPVHLMEMTKLVGLSPECKQHLSSKRLLALIQNPGTRKSVGYLLNRVTSLDWGLLDLFYQLTIFNYFRGCVAAAEQGQDEGPICNLGLITGYISRYQEERGRPIMTAGDFIEDRFQRHFFMSYLFAIYRLGETEFEDKEDPFPRGRVSLITIHQAKGLEFPVVILGTLYRQDRKHDVMEKIVRKEIGREGDPLDRMSEFDNSRLFYVALSRAKNLLVLPRPRGRGQRMLLSFRKLVSDGLPNISTIDWTRLEKAREISYDPTGKAYSYTSDYLLYKRCPRQYMLFRKYGFIPARSQVMLFGSLIHQTIEDLHNYLLAQKDAG